MNTGTIKKLVSDKYFGFIVPDAGGQDLFFHKDALVDVGFEDLREGDKVSFDTESSPKGPKATNVKKA